MSDAWSKLCHDFGDAQRKDAERRQLRELDLQLQRQQAHRARGAVQQLMADLLGAAEQRAHDLERRTGAAVQVHLHQPPAAVGSTLLSWVEALKLSLGEAVVYVYAFHAPGSGIYLHLLPYHRDSIRRGRRLLSELAAAITPGEASTYELRPLIDGKVVDRSMRLDDLLLRAFRLLLWVNTANVAAGS